MNNKCQVFTPENIANQMLDLAHYRSKLYGKRVLESACGEGNLLACVIKRYILDCLNHQLPVQTVKKGLERDIWGYDIDEECCDACRAKLSEVAKQFGIVDVQWNVHNANSLHFCPTLGFDYIFGNPPYITYRELDNTARQELKSMYKSCGSGAFDYCYAFLERDLYCLNKEGKLVYLLPSSIYKNVYAKELRKLTLPYIAEVIDFATIKLFGSVLTSSTILMCDGGWNRSYFHYRNTATGVKYRIEKESLRSLQKWIFVNDKREMTAKYKFSDFFTASIVVATLLNEAFVLRNATETDTSIDVDGIAIEKQVVRKTASPRTLRYGKNEYIIFPYHFEKGLQRYTEDAFSVSFPNAMSHLRKYYDRLIARNSDKNSKWFEYGRSQALTTICQKKLLLSTVVTKCVEVYELGEDVVPYSGIYIRTKGALSLDVAKQILQSKEFYEYVCNIGIYASGESIRITAKDIESYEFDWCEEYNHGKT